ncbi:Uncharacterized conserved protein YeaO, DUF488 family [Pseudidiomarina indica]|uniref:Uncharacterized conserved protein YeaO, DUF488 family n=1 Tax=Pseudidiomarina indica TaxID=1159017 RepID=A0A1G6D9Y2_9GAMM|nr:DUF488 family protein [Pseudidiomarina indica]SDB41967.1 Uncharacterized conserved protein YeaO, DUF488 family [Pseudidiomarina indica]
MARYQIKFKRVYDAPAATDGVRVLADRLWPRGIKKVALAHDDWCKDACPSHALRQQYHAQVIDWPTFAQAYADELAANPTSLTPLLAYARQSTLTLLSAVKDVEHSHLPVLKQAILTRLEDDNEELDHHN